MSEQLNLSWPVDKHVINQYFGKNPDFYKPFGLPGHEGLDIYAPMNANVYAAADGEVYQANHPPNNPYGLQVRIKHVVGGSVYKTIYAHLAQVFVSVGQQVKVGEQIALADNTGNSFGSHLHLTLKIDGAQTPGYPPGIVDPWPYFQAVTKELPPTSDLIIYTTDQLSLRNAPTTESNRLAILANGEALTVLGDADAAKARIGKQDEWIQVRTETGLSGYVAAWFVHLTGQVAPDSDLVVYPTDILSVRAQPTSASNRLTIVATSDALTVLGDTDRAFAKIGQQDQWLNVRAPGGYVGYVAAWFVQPESAVSFGLLTPPPMLTVYPIADLDLQAQPTINSPKTSEAHPNEPLKVLEDDQEEAEARVGQERQWLYVQTEEGERGWAAAQVLALEQA